MNGTKWTRRALRTRRRGQIRLEALEERTLLSVGGNYEGSVGLLPSQGSKAEVLPGKWITQFDGVSGPASQQLATIRDRLVQAGLTDIQVTQSLGAPGLVSLQSSIDISLDKLQARLAGVPGYHSLSQDSIVSIASLFPNDPLFPNEWGLNNTSFPGADIHAPQAWDLTTGSHDVVVADIDTGMDMSHPDLVNNLWTNPGEIPGDGIDNDANGFIDDVHGWDFVNNDNDPTDDHGHGTHTAGTIGAEGNNGIGVTGVNWNVQIMPLKFLDAGGFGSTSAAIAAINYATMERASYGVNLVATNNSWGGGGFETDLRDAIAASGNAGILFVAAAGNASNNNDVFPFYPASYDLDNIISVAATTISDDRAGFSNYGATTVDLGAPGQDVFSTFPGGYGYLSGTSMATPHVTGVVALAASLAPGATAAQLKAAILTGVDPIPSLAGITLTGGRLNAYNTLQALGMTVISTDPADGSIVSAPPSQYVVDFSLPYDPATVDASDFTVNGIPADGVDLTDPDTLTFTFTTDPVTNQGLQSMAIAPGAVAPDPGVSTLPFLGFTGTFRYDAVLLQVDSTTPAPGGVFSLPGPFAYLVHFNEPVDPASVQTSDLALSGVADALVSAVSVSGDGQTATFTLDGMHDEGVLVASIAADAIADVYGNPNAAFSASYNVDFGTTAYQVPLTATAPLGSWIYDPVAHGVIGPAGDTDSFTISVDPGQTITVLAQADATLRPTIQLSVSGLVVATATAPAAGVDAVIQTYKVPGQIAAGSPAPQTYTVTVSGAAGSTGSYTLKIILNAALETESHGGSSNDSAAGAQSLENSFIGLSSAGGGSTAPARGAVLGQIDAAPTTTVPSYSPYDNGFPFNIGRFSIPDQRYQQIYSASQFAGGGVIDALHFALSSFQFSGPPVVTPIDMQISLGYAATTTNTASAHFDDNIGAGFTTVFDGIYTIPGGGTPLPSAITIDVADTFNYDPSLGDLLVEVRVRNAAWSFQFAAGFEPGATTRIWNFEQDQPDGIVDYGFGLGTQFQFAGADPQDNYTFKLSAAQTATIALTSLGGGNVNLALISPSGTTLALGADDLASNADQVIRNFVAPTTGTYRLMVTGDGGAQYSLIVTRNADLDAESNNDLSTAQPLITNQAGGAQWVIGYAAGATGTLYGASPSGELITIDTVTGIGTFVGFPGGSTEIEYDNDTGRAFRQFPDGSFAGQEFDIETGAPIGGVIFNGGSYTGLEWVSDTLYGTAIYGAGGPSELRILDPWTGASQLIGPTGVGPISGLAYDKASGVMYGIAGGGQPSSALYRIDLTTGAATTIGATGFRAGSLEFGPDGMLYGGGGTQNAGSLYRIDPATAAATFVGNTGFGTLSGLARMKAAIDNDFYKITADGNKTIQVETTTPASQSGEFVNNLDPMLRLYDAAGNVLATNDNGASDGRNAKLSYKVPKDGGGTFYLEVLASDATTDPTKGEYILSVKGTTRTLPPFVVTANDPANGALLTAVPVTDTVDVNDVILQTTLQASDLKVDGVSATGVIPSDGDTATFDLSHYAFSYGGKYYALTQNFGDWHAAEAQAAALGGHLVAVNDVQENGFLVQHFATGPNAQRMLWIGLNDFAEEGTFVWSNGDPVSYTNFYPGEPNDFLGMEDGVELNLAAFYGSPNGWNDYLNTGLLQGIMELPLLPAGYWLASDGTHTVSIASGAFNDVQNTPIGPFSSTFTLDMTAPRVISSSIQEGELVDIAGSLTVTIGFSEPMNTAVIDPSDVYLQGLYRNSFIYASSVSFDPSGTVATITFDGPNFPDDAYRLTLVSSSSAFSDLAGWALDGEPLSWPIPPNVSGDGSAGGDFYVSFVTDATTQALPVPLVPIDPLGGLIYQTPYNATGTIAFGGDPGDTDDFTIALDANQTVTILVGASSGLQPTVSLFDSADNPVGGPAVAPAPGTESVYQATLIPGAGTYRISIGSASGLGLYSIRFIVNAAVEEEAHGGARNDAIPGQSLDSSFLDLGGGVSRGAVVGRSDGAGGYQASALPFDFIDISSTGTAVLQGSDDGSVWLSPSDLNGFQFTLFGSTSDNLYVSANGYLYLPTGSGNVYAMTRDLYVFSPPGSVYWQVFGTGDEQTLVVQWDKVGFCCFNGYDPITFEAVLSEADGSVRFNYLDLQTDNSSANEGLNSTVGVQGYSPSGNYNSLILPTFDAPNQYVGTGRSTQIASLPPSADYYAFQLDAGQSATIGVAALTSINGLVLQIQDGSGNVLAQSAGGTSSFDAAISNFVAQAGGTYYAVITSQTVGDYSLVVTRNADFDTEPNDSIDTAQPLGLAAGATNALGYVEPPKVPLYTTGNDGVSLISIDEATGIGSVVGPFGTYWTYTAAFTPDGTLWTIIYGFDPSLAQLAKVDLASGAVTPVGSPAWTGSPLFAMDADASGQLYAGNWDGTFFSVDTSTGQFTQIGATGGMGFPNTMDFAFDNNGTLWALDYGFNLYTIDPASGVGTYRTSIFGLNSNAMGLMVDPSDNALYLTTYTFSSNLYQLDPNTGLATVVGSVGIPYPHGGDFLPEVPHQAGDFYQVTVGAGQTLTAATIVPASGSGEFVNNLDSLIFLYDEAGNPVTPDISTKDGANAFVSYTSAAGGTYYVKVAGANNTIGEYALSVSGTTPVVPPFQVASTDPADGTRLQGPLTEYTVNFNDLVLLTTLSADDLMFEGMPATGVTIVDGDTAVFTVPAGFGEGLVHVTIAAGAISDIQGTPIGAFAATYYNDVTAPRVTDSSIQEGDLLDLPAGNLVYTVSFSEAMDPSVDIYSAAPIYGLYLGVYYNPTSIVFDDSGMTATITYAGLPEDAYTLILISGWFRDSVGIPLDGEPVAWPIGPNQSGDGSAGGDFYVDFATDAATRALPVPLVPVNPLGGMIYQTPYNATGTIAFGGDTDDFTITLDANQTVTILVGASSGSQPMVSLFDSADNPVGTTAIAPAPGTEAVYQATLIPGADTYRISIGSASGLGLYSVRFIVNAAVEEEAHGGPTDDTLLTAQDINSSFIDLTAGTAQRGAVIGDVSEPLTLYGSNRNAQWLSVDLSTGSATVIANGVNNFRGYTDLARNPVTGVLYGTGARGDSGFYSIDPLTGAGTPIGYPSSGVHSLAWSLDGTTLYAVSFGTFGTIDPGTGAFTPLAGAPDFVHGMDFQPGTGTLYATVGRFSGNLYTVDPSTGAFSFVAPLSRLYFSLEFLPDGTLLGGGSDGGLYTIDPVTGSENLIGFTGTDVLLGLEGVPSLDSQDWYSFTLDAGQTTTLALEGSGSGLGLELVNSSGVVLAPGTSSANLDQVVNNFAVTVSGIYYAHVTRSVGKGDYSLVVTRDADFDTEANNTQDTAQPLGASHGALGVLSGPSSVSIGSIFEGLSASESGGYRPPDTNAAVGNNFVVETVNIAIRVFDKTTGDILLNQSLESFFGAFSYGDPYVVYDDVADRWYVSAFDSTHEGLFLAVSVNGNPLDGFLPTYHLTDVGGFPDYEKLGYNYDAIFISYNDFGPAGTTQATIASIDKAALLSGTLTYYVSVPQYQFRGMPPAQMHGDTTGGVEWFVSTDGSDFSGNTIRVTKMENYLSGSPTFSYWSLPVADYYAGNLRADQPGGGVTVFPNTTTYQVQYHNGHLVTAMASGTAADGFSYPKGLYYQVDVSSGTPAILQQGVIDPGFGVAVQMPSVDEDINGNLGFSWIESSSSEYLSMWVGTLNTSGGFASQVVAPGGGFFYWNDRIGDYSSTVLDPADGITFWSANEYIGADGASNIWRTKVVSFQVGIKLDSDWYSTSVAGGGTLELTINVPASGPGEFVNDLVPRIEVYDADGTLVGWAEGIGAVLTTDPLAEGTYSIRVTTTTSSGGEYVLSVSTDMGAGPLALSAGGGGMASSLATNHGGAPSASATLETVAPAPVAIPAPTSTTSTPGPTAYSRNSRTTPVDQAIAALVVDPTIPQGERLADTLSWDRLLTSRRRSLITKI